MPQVMDADLESIPLQLFTQRHRRLVAAQRDEIKDGAKTKFLLQLHQLQTAVPPADSFHIVG